MNEFILEKYENILRKDPGALDSVYEVAGDNDMSDADRLYLCTFAPVLYRFTGWILDAAKKSGTERLYFCARDAYPIFKAAEVIRDSGITVPELKYLELSRFSVREPLYGVISREECLDQLFLRGIDITAERVLKRAGFSTEESLMILEDIGFREPLAEPLSTRDLGDLRERVEASRLFWELLNLRSDAARSEALVYFRTQGLTDGAISAIVDSGWVGTMQQSLARLLAFYDPYIKLSGYYFGLYDIPAGSSPADYHCFYFSPESRIMRKVYFCNSMFEVLCQAPFGMTEGYRDARPVYDMSLSDEEIETAEGRTKLLCEYVRIMLKKNAKAYIQPNDGMEYALFKALMAEPGMFEVNAFGDILFSDDVKEDGQIFLARKLDKKEIHRYRTIPRLLDQMIKSRKQPKESAWMEGSIARVCGEDAHAMQSELYAYHRYRTLLYLRKTLNNRRW